jgi:hypothetical protein
MIQWHPSDGKSAGAVEGKVRERRRPNAACLRVIHVRNELEGGNDVSNAGRWERGPIVQPSSPLPFQTLLLLLGSHRPMQAVKENAKEY